MLTDTYTTTAEVQVFISNSLMNTFHIFTFHNSIFCFHIKLECVSIVTLWLSWQDIRRHTHTHALSALFFFWSPSECEWLHLAVLILVWLGCSQILAGIQPLMLSNHSHHPLTEECFWKERRRRMSWQRERRTRKYFMIWNFIRSRLGIPDLSLDARVISRQALSKTAGILFFFQPPQPQPPYIPTQYCQ